MKTIFLTLLISVMLISCTESKNDDNQFVIDVGVVFNILDNQGNDLLNPVTENSYLTENMELFYLINNEPILVQEQNPDIGSHNGIMFINETSPYRLKIFTNIDFDTYISDINGVKKGEHIAYLQLNETDIDTIKTEWEYKKNHYFVNKKIWYNGVEKTQEILENTGFFTIEK